MLSSIFYIILAVSFVEERANMMCILSHVEHRKNITVFYVDDDGDDRY